MNASPRFHVLPFLQNGAILACLLLISRSACGQETRPIPAAKSPEENPKPKAAAKETAGRTVLVYEVDQPSAREQGLAVDDATMDRMRITLTKRLDPKGTKEIKVRVTGPHRIEVLLPFTDSKLVQEKKELIVKSGRLQFGIVAMGFKDQELIDRALALRSDQNELRSKSENESPVEAAWHDISDPTSTKESWEGIGHRTVPGRDSAGGEIQMHQILIKQDHPSKAVTGALLSKVRAHTDSLGNPAVAFTFNARGAALFYKLTSDNLPDRERNLSTRLAILLEGKVHTAPVIRSAIGADGEISGKFTQQEVNDLVAVLNAGALPIPLRREPVSVLTIDP